MHTLVTLSHCQLRVYCVYVCVCVWVSPSSVTVSEREHEHLLMKTLITAERLFPHHRFANLSLLSNLAPSLPPSLTISLTHSLIRMKTHLQSAGTKNQLVTPPSHYDNWVLWASCKAPKHTPSSSDACWLSFSLSHTCTVIHFTAEQTSLGSIQTFILTKWCMLSHICSIQDAMVLYVLGSWVRHGSVPCRILLPLSHDNWLHKNSVLRVCFITHFTFLSGLFVFWTKFFFFLKIGRYSDIESYIATSLWGSVKQQNISNQIPACFLLMNPNANFL